MKKISQEKVDAIQRDRSAGAETTELMEKYHVSKTIIYRYTTPPPRARKDYHRQSPLNESDIGKIGALWRAGWTLENIAWDIGGCTEDEVMEVIRRNKGKMEWT